MYWVKQKVSLVFWRVCLISGQIDSQGSKWLGLKTVNNNVDTQQGSVPPEEGGERQQMKERIRRLEDVEYLSDLQLAQRKRVRIPLGWTRDIGQCDNTYIYTNTLFL